jgi:hypothetical protein
MVERAGSASGFSTRTKAALSGLQSWKNPEMAFSQGPTANVLRPSGCAYALDPRPLAGVTRRSGLGPQFRNDKVGRGGGSAAVPDGPALSLRGPAHGFLRQAPAGENHDAGHLWARHWLCPVRSFVLGDQAGPACRACFAHHPDPGLFHLCARRHVPGGTAGGDAGAWGERCHYRHRCHRRGAVRDHGPFAIGHGAGGRVFLGRGQYRLQAGRADRHAVLRGLGEPCADCSSSGAVGADRGTAGDWRGAGQFQSQKRGRRGVQRLCRHAYWLWPVELSAQALSGRPDRAILPAGPGFRHRLCRDADG